MGKVRKVDAFPKVTQMGVAEPKSSSQTAVSVPSWVTVMHLPTQYESKVSLTMLSIQLNR